MVLAKKQLSKVVAIVLVAMCAVAFMPMLNGEAFAAAKAKKPAKVTVQSAKQVSGTYKVKVTWKKAKNAKTYNIKIDKKVVKKNYKKLTFTSAALKAGKHKVYVQAVNGKKKGAWSKAKTVTVKPLPAKVEIDGIPAVGETLKATVYDKDGKELTSGVTYQWYRTGANTGGDNPIAGATSAEYTVVKADKGKPLYVTAKAVGKEVKAAETAIIGAESTFFIANANQYHTVPVVGDTMIIGINVDGEFSRWVNAGDQYDYQWFADGAAINNATGFTYTVYKTDVDKALSVELTKINPDRSTTVYKTEPTEKVIEGTLPTAARLVGMSTPAEYNKDGSLKTKGTPAVGDTLSVEFTKPVNAADEGATYQWTRGGVNISGATSASYTVKEADLDKELSVKITRSDKVAVADVEAVNIVKKSFGAATVTLAKTEATTAGYIDTFTATVKIGTTAMTLNTDYTLAWYADAVSEENQLYQSGAAVTGATVGGTDNYFIGKDATKATSLAGKTLFAVATGAGDYTGTAQGVAASAVTKAVAIDKTIKANALSGGKVVAGVTTLEAAVTPADADVSYQWSSKTADTDFAPISGATKASYVPTVADSEAGVTAYSVTIASTVASRVLANASTSDAYDVAWYDQQGAVVITVNKLEITNTTADRGMTPSTTAAILAQHGDVLAASSDVKSADANLTFTWTLRTGKSYDESNVIKTAQGPTFTVPNDAPLESYVSLSAVSTSDKYEVRTSTNPNENPNTIGHRWAKVQGEFAVALSSDKDKYNAAGDKTFDGVAHPVVGAKITAKVLDGKTTVTAADLTWTVDGNVVKTGTGSYTLVAADFGKKLVVTAEGTGTVYAGAVASAETGVIGAEASIAVTGTRSGAAIPDINGQLKVGDELSASTSVGDMDGVVYNWTIAEGENVVDTATGSTLKIINRYVGCSVYVEASAENLMPPEGGSLAWLNDNAIGQ